MKKVLVAINNDTLLEQIKKCGKYLVHNYDISDKESVIEYLSKNIVDVIITRDELLGNLSKEEYVKEIKKIQPGVKIIMCVKSLSEIYKGFLFANEVFNILEGEEIRFSKILDMIDSVQGKVILKRNDDIETTRIRNSGINVMTKQTLCVFGTSGAGKSYVSSILGYITSKKLKLNTILVDMDIQNAAIDIYNNLNSSQNTLQYVMEEVDNNNFNSETLQNISTKAKRNGKLSFITNNVGIYECQNKLSEDYYDCLYTEAENKYDVTILDLPSTPFLDVVPFSLTRANKLFFVINPNFISIRQAIKYLDLITNIWKVDRDKINIVINKQKNESLSIKQVKAMLKNYNICLQIKYDSKIESVINGMDELSLDNVNGVDNIGQLFGLNVDNCEELRGRSLSLNKILGARS